MNASNRLETALEDTLAEIGQRLVDGQHAFVGDSVFSLDAASSAGELSSVIKAGACRIGGCANPTRAGDLASHIDHTLLKPDATSSEIDALCAEALEHRFASVCVNGTWVGRCAEVLAGSSVLTCTVVGFPLGASVPDAKAFEARRAIDAGACEIDMVLNVGALKSGLDNIVENDIRTVAEACHGANTRLKVILETCLLERNEIVRACRAAKAAGADFVKTSTGFAGGGATVDDVRLMRDTVGPILGVKASGGVRDEAAARAMIEAGATRIGASASVAIVSSDGDTSAGGY